MAQALPFLKLGVLLVKQASKPLARFVKSKALSNEYLGDACHFIGQTWHSSTTRLHYMVQGHRVKTVKPLNEQEAVQSGSELLSDGFVLAVGVGALILEAKRSARASAVKAAQKAARQHAKIEAMMHLDVTLKDLAQYTKELHLSLEKADAQYRKTTKHALFETLPPMPQSLVDYLEEHALNPTEVVALEKTAQLAEKTGALSETDAWIEAGKTTWLQVSTESIAKLIRLVGSIWSGEDDDDGGGGMDDDGPDLDSIFGDGADDDL